MIGNNNQGLSEDIAARHTNFVSSVSQEAQMVWLEPTVADLSAPVTNRFITHVEDIYYINNNIHNTNIQNVSLGMSFLNDIMLKTADVYAGVYNQRLSMMEKSITTANNHRTENVDNSNTTVQSAYIHRNTVSTVNNLTELQNVSAGDIIKLSKETINSLKNTDITSNNAINISSSEFVHQQNNEVENLTETIEKNEQHITALENRLQNMTTVEKDNTTEKKNESAQSADTPTTTEQTTIEVQKGANTQRTEQVFNSKTLTNREQSTQENTNIIDRTTRPTRHYQNSNVYNNRDITSASVIYDENGRRETPAENTVETTKEIVKEALRTADKASSTPPDTQVITSESSENKVITSTDININKTQNTAESSVSNIDIHHTEAPLTYNLQGGESEVSQSKTELIKTVSETVENRIKSEKTTQTTDKTTERTTQSRTTGEVINVKNLATLQENATLIKNSLQNVDRRLTQISLNTETLTENGVYNTQSYLKRETLLHNLTKTENNREGDISNVTNATHPSATFIENIHLNSESTANNTTLSPLSAISNILKSSRFNISNSALTSQSITVTSNPSGSVSYSITNGAPTVHNNQLTTQNEITQNNNLQNIAVQSLAEVSIVHKQEVAPTAEQTRQEEDEIVTIKKTKKIENTETTETVNHINNKKNIVVSGGNTGAVQMDKAQINKLAEKVYRQLETRLRTERNRRGMK